MKKSLLFMGLLTLLLSACTFTSPVVPINTETIQGSGTITSEERSVSGFDAVDLRGIGDLHIVHGDTESLTIKADENLLPYITTEVDDHQLVIATKEYTNLTPSQSIEYTLTVKSLSAVTLSGFGNIDADKLEGSSVSTRSTGSGDVTIGEVKGDVFDLYLTGFGNVNLGKVEAATQDFNLTGSGDITVPSLSATELKVLISGFGDAEISGTADDQTLSLTGSGNYKAGDLQTKTTKITISGFGHATTWTTDSIDITITGSGNVEYYGSPVINTTLTGMGEIKSLGEH